MLPYDLRFATGHTLSHALRILLEDDTFHHLTQGVSSTSGDAVTDAASLSPFARYVYMDAASRNRELARALKGAARKTETKSGLEPNRRRIDPRQFARQLVQLRVRLDAHGVPYDFFANEALPYTTRRRMLGTPHLADVAEADVLDHVVRRWGDPAVRGMYPLQMARWDQRFQHKRKADTLEHRAMYEVVQQRIADVVATGGSPIEALRPHLGRFMPVSEAVARFGRNLVEAAQQPASMVLPRNSTVADTLPASTSKLRERRGPKPKEDALEWAQASRPDLLDRMVRKELAARSPALKPPPRPREKSAQQKAESLQRAQDLARMRDIADPDNRRTAVDGWVRTWIRPDDLQAEPATAATTWAGYRHLSPLERTERFLEAYIDMYRELHERYLDAAVGPRKQPAKPQLATNGLQVIRCVWKARALADALGLPYDMFLRAIMERKLNNGKWTHAGRPNQLFADLDLACARGVHESSTVPEATPETTDRPGCFGYPTTGKHVPCTTCTVRSACEEQVARTHEHLRAKVGTDDPQLRRQRQQDNARAKKYRTKLKERRQAP